MALGLPYLGQVDDLRERNLETTLKFEEHAEGGVDLAPFYGADVVAVERRAKAQLLLREPAAGAEFADGVTKRVMFAAVRRRRHRAVCRPAGGRELSEAMTTERVLDLFGAAVERTKRRGDLDPE